MAKNFVEEGKTVAIVASAAISSGDLVQVGDQEVRLARPVAQRCFCGGADRYSTG